MHIAIVDDRDCDREHLSSLLEAYLRKADVFAAITCYSSGEEILCDFEAGRFQCVFIDIYMSGIDGMETARAIYRADPACRLIFCTSSISHAVTSYEVRAAYYLIKPISPERLADAMDAACSNIIETNMTFTVNVKGHGLTLDCSDVYYVDSSDRRTRVHLRHRVLDIDESVSDILKKLTKDERFLLCNRNTAVNMDRIALVEEADFRLDNGDIVPIRQRGRAAAKKDFLAWSLRDIRRK